MYPLIYIAGPFRGPTPLDVRRNVEAARDLGFEVAGLGGFPVIPHTMTADFDKQLTDEFWLRGTLDLLKVCEAIVLAPTWRTSRGATEEYRLALELQLPIFDTSLGHPNWRLEYLAWRDSLDPKRPTGIYAELTRLQKRVADLEAGLIEIGRAAADPLLGLEQGS